MGAQIKPINFQSVFLPLNAIITGVVFFLLSPTTQIYASWFPDKKDHLWLFPLGVVGASAVLWVMGSLSTPFLIKSGFFEDRRRGPRTETAEERVKHFKAALPVINSVFHMLLLIGLCISVIYWSRSRSIEATPNRVSWNYVLR